ncbi:helix-turn-helix transcriptional regulator [Streptosporangium sp. NPDC020145]|uniref:Helix-turn-helix domain-containing protein n=1 Tax=Streptosporangium jomthongense TaxID=1193683 RepID=A0ABV8FE17_9ACTN
MTHIYSPTVRRRRLSAALRRARSDAGLTAEAAAKLLGWPASKVTRIERNEWRRPTVSDVTDMLDVYGVTDEAVRKAMSTLARQARERGWWEGELRAELGGSLVEFETEASKIRVFQALLVPGLLQTADYARAVFRGGMIVDQDMVERRVHARLARQQILERDHPLNLWVILDEAALIKHVGGPAVMRAQIHHLIDMAARPNIGIQVVPNTAGAHASMSGAFTILSYPTPDDPELVYIETGTNGDLYLEGTEEIERYTLKYDHIRGSALSVEASVARMMNLAEQLK